MQGWVTAVAPSRSRGRFSSTADNSCGELGLHNHSDSVRVTPNLKRRLSKFTNKGSTHAIAGTKAHFPRYHVNRVPAVF